MKDTKYLSYRKKLSLLKARIEIMILIISLISALFKLISVLLIWA